MVKTTFLRLNITCNENINVNCDYEIRRITYIIVNSNLLKEKEKVNVNVSWFPVDKETITRYFIQSTHRMLTTISHYFRHRLLIPSISAPPSLLLLLHHTFPLPMDEYSLRRALYDKQSAVDAQGNAVRALNAAKASKSHVDSIEKRIQVLVGSGNGDGASVSREAFRQTVRNALERRLFYIPSFKIYRGVAGLYDNGPPGCAIQSNVLAFMRQVSRGIALSEVVIVMIDCGNVFNFGKLLLSFL